MSLLSWAAGAWKATAWRVGAWLASAGTVQPARKPGRTVAYRRSQVSAGAQLRRALHRGAAQCSAQRVAPRRSAARTGLLAMTAQRGASARALRRGLLTRAAAAFGGGRRLVRAALIASGSRSATANIAASAADRTVR